MIGLKQREEGLSLVEVLVSMTLMTVLIVAITSPLAGLFKFSKDSKDAVEANSAARSALEIARAAWLTYPTVADDDPNADEINARMEELNTASLIRYNKNCIGPEVLDHIDYNITFNIYQLDRYNEVIQTLDSSYFTHDCKDVPHGPYMPGKRIQVNVIDADGNSQFAAHVDVPAPAP